MRILLRTGVYSTCRKVCWFSGQQHAQGKHYFGDDSLDILLEGHIRTGLLRLYCCDVHMTLFPTAIAKDFGLVSWFLNVILHDSSMKEREFLRKLY